MTTNRSRERQARKTSTTAALFLPPIFRKQMILDGPSYAGVRARESLVYALEVVRWSQIRFERARLLRSRKTRCEPASCQGMTLVVPISRLSSIRRADFSPRGASFAHFFSNLFSRATKSLIFCHPERASACEEYASPIFPAAFQPCRSGHHKHRALAPEGLRCSTGRRYQTASTATLESGTSLITERPTEP